jgi:RimJ/RimL family protein N-acetyltransferase
VRLVTAHLELRRFTPGDFPLVSRLYSDPEVTRFLGGVKDRAGIERLMSERILEYYDRHPGLGTWATIERSTGACVGMHVLNYIRGETIVQIGYILFREFWGRGYATEMARPLLRYGFTSLGLARIAGITDLDHVVSQRVLAKIGLERRPDREFTHPDYQGHGPFAFFDRDAGSWITAHHEEREGSEGA